METSSSQQQSMLVAAFSRGEVGGVGPTERIDTHLSHVFLTPDRAFKLKRAIKLAFADFTTLEARSRACHAEIEVNIGSARRLYLRAAPICCANGRFFLGEAASGDVVDWVVEMRRFPSDQQFDRLAGAGRLSCDLVARAASMIAHRHLQTPPCEGGAQFSTIIAGLARTSAEGAAKCNADLAWRELLSALEGEAQRQSALIESRRKAGKVRRTHGDLHLRNVCVFEGEVIAFDAIEFDEALATCDVLYDFAFLLMDLVQAGLPRHANTALNRYWDEACEDEEALQILGFFMSLRAAVRMAVALEAGRIAEAARYLGLATHLLKPHAHLAAALGGLSGTGKTRLAQALAPLLPGPAGARILRSDVLRKRKLGLAMEAHADPSAYAPAARAQTYAELMSAGMSAAQGASVILDASFQTAASRRLVRATFGERLHAYWLQAPLSVRLQRISGRTGDASDADVKVAASQCEPQPLEADWRRIDATQTSEDMALQICGLMSAGARP